MVQYEMCSIQHKSTQHECRRQVLGNKQHSCHPHTTDSAVQSRERSKENGSSFSCLARLKQPVWVPKWAEGRLCRTPQRNVWTEALAFEGKHWNPSEPSIKSSSKCAAIHFQRLAWASGWQPGALSSILFYGRTSMASHSDTLILIYIYLLESIWYSMIVWYLINLQVSKQPRWNQIEDILTWYMSCFRVAAWVCRLWGCFHPHPGWNRRETPPSPAPEKSGSAADDSFCKSSSVV